MLAFFYFFYRIANSIKENICDAIDDVKDRRNRKIDDVAYIGKDGLRDYSTGHKLQYINQHKYLDIKTGKYVKKNLSQSDIEKEKANKERAIKLNFKVYACSDYYLPNNTCGTVYKSVDTDRLYIERHISTKDVWLPASESISGFYYISINPDNYGRVELRACGNKLMPNEEKLSSCVFNLKYVHDQNEQYVWRC